MSCPVLSSNFSKCLSVMSVCSREGKGRVGQGKGGGSLIPGMLGGGMCGGGWGWW